MLKTTQKCQTVKTINVLSNDTGIKLHLNKNHKECYNEIYLKLINYCYYMNYEFHIHKKD